MSTSHCRVIVIGAGPAGISAARDLRAAGISDVVVLEASNRVGGRILNSGEVEDPIIRDIKKSGTVELGPSFIHGDCENEFLEFLKANGGRIRPNIKTKTLTWPNYFYFGKEAKLLNGDEAKQDVDLQRMLEMYEMLDGMDPKLIPEETLLQYFVRMGVPSRVLDMADAIFANDYGADMSSVGLKETVLEQHSWKYGEDYLILEGCTFSDVFRTMAEGLNIRLGWHVKLIEHGAAAAGARVRVTSATGATMTADALVVTAPLPLLRSGDIAFAPPLPAAKAAAMDAVRVGNAVKILLRFREPVWPADLWDVVCSDSFVPEFWLSPPSTPRLGAPPAADDDIVVIGFVAGARADRVGQMPAAEAARRALQQLDAMFGDAARPAPATAACTGWAVKDWSKEPLARGAYTHPSVGALGMRDVLAAPVGDVVFFAGEATQTGVNPCLHGAMETGRRAAAEVARALGVAPPPPAVPAVRSRL